MAGIGISQQQIAVDPVRATTRLWRSAMSSVDGEQLLAGEASVPRIVQVATGSSRRREPGVPALQISTQRPASSIMGTGQQGDR